MRAHWCFGACVDLCVQQHVTTFPTFFRHLSSFLFWLSGACLIRGLTRSHSNQCLQHLPFFAILSPSNSFDQPLHFLSAPDTMIFFKHLLMFVMSSINFMDFQLLAYPVALSQMVLGYQRILPLSFPWLSTSPSPVKPYYIYSLLSDIDSWWFLITSTMAFFFLELN